MDDFEFIKNMIEKELVKIENIVPQTEIELRQLRKSIADFLEKRNLIPPLQQAELFRIAEEYLNYHPEYEVYIKTILIIINNYVWQKEVADIPFDRRVLLLPKCVRNSESCKASIDELGLLCAQCGGCKLDNYIQQAETLGYHVIVSEGTGAVSVLLQSGQIECVVGVACLDSFERSFPLTLQQAIPSIAIPLFNSDCKDSKVDESWLMEVLQLKNTETSRFRPDFKQSKEMVDKWFESKYLNKFFPSSDGSIQIANKWLQAGGKRWRPMIMLSVYQALSNNEIAVNESIAKLAIAVESFHKASLAHDDIVDNDTERYGDASLLKEHNPAIALNTGDLLLSYGYQLIADSGLEPPKIQQLLRIASKGHQQLCLGQGEELSWQNQHKMPSVAQIMNIFANKTAPAFEVALKFGGIAATASEELLSVFEKYSHALGIAYQIKDDLEDFNPNDLANDIAAFRPSLVLAILNEKLPGKLDVYFQKLSDSSNGHAKEIYKMARENNAIDEAKSFLEDYKNKAFESLSTLSNVSVKILLFRLINKILPQQ